MKDIPGEFDWTDLHTFLVVAKEKSAVAATRRLKIDVSTVRRRLAAFQSAVGFSLFMKGGKSFQLTDEGQRIFVIASNMDALSHEISRDATDAARDLAGVVRVSTMEGFGGIYLAPRLSRILDIYPKLSVELVSSPHILNLAEREADVSLNMMQPRHGRLVARKAAQFGVGLYGAPAYLKKAGTPQHLGDLSDHTFITYVDELIAVPHVRWLPDVIATPRKRFTATSVVAQFEAAQSGGGLIMLPHFMVRQDCGLIRLMPTEINLVRDWWLVVHQDLRAVPRIRAVADFIVAALRRDSGILMNSGATKNTPIHV